MYTFLKCFHKSVKFIFIFKYSNSFLPLAYICLYICFDFSFSQYLSHVQSDSISIGKYLIVMHCVKR